MSTAYSTVAYTQSHPKIAIPPAIDILESPSGSQSAAGTSTGASPRYVYGQPETPNTHAESSLQAAQQQQQQQQQQPSHYTLNHAVPREQQQRKTSAGQRRGSISSYQQQQIPAQAQAGPPKLNMVPQRGVLTASPPLQSPIERAKSAHQHLNRIGDSSIYPSHAEATLSGFIVQLTEKLQSHLNNNNSKGKHLARDKSFVPVSWPMARYGGLCLLWYGCSAVSNNTGKDVLARCPCPVTLTLVQFGLISLYCVLFCAARQHLANRAGGKVNRRRLSQVLFYPEAGSWWKDLLDVLGVKRASKTALHGTLMMSFFQISGHVFGSMATARMSVSTVHTIKALSPLFTVLSYALLFRVKYSSSTYISLVPLTLGVMLACSLDLRANLGGLVCALGSTMIFVSQNIFSKKLLPKDATEEAAAAGGSASLSRSQHGQSSSTTTKLDKMNLLLYSSGMAFLLMIPMWAYSDLPALLAPKPMPVHAVTSTALATLFFVNGTVHFLQCFLAFSILARSSPVAYSIASLLKRVAVICLAILWFGQSIELIQGFGMATTFFGLWMYNRSKNDVERGERKRINAERRGNLVLPTTASDARLMELGSASSLGASPEISPSTTPMPFEMRQQADSPAPPQQHGLGIAGFPPSTAVQGRSIYQPAVASNGRLTPATPRAVSPNLLNGKTGHFHHHQQAFLQQQQQQQQHQYAMMQPSMSPAIGRGNQLQPLDMSASQSKLRPAAAQAGYRQ